MIQDFFEYKSRCPNFPNSGHVTTPPKDQLFSHLETSHGQNPLEFKRFVEGNGPFQENKIKMINRCNQN